MLDLATADAATFAPHRGTAFDVAGDDDAALVLELVEVNERGAGSPGGRAQFSLLFRGPSSPVLAQQIYPLRHAELGELELFLVPVGPIDGGFGYEAAFN